MTGWIGLPTESTASIITALKPWLTQTELLGQTKSVRFICSKSGSAFTSAKFIAACNDLAIKLEAAAPEHQEMSGICEPKWCKVHNTANILLNTAQLGGAFFHYAHACAIHIVKSCPAKNVTDQVGNPTTPCQYRYVRKPSPANFCLFGCPVYFKGYEPTFPNKSITHKQQLQRASLGIFIGFLENSASWLVYSPEHPQHIVITHNAYFHEDFSSALAFNSKPFAGAIPIQSHLDPMDSKLLTTLNPQLSTKLDLQPTLASCHPLSLKNPKTLSNLPRNKIIQIHSLQITNMMTMTLI